MRFHAQLGLYADEPRFPMHPVRIVDDTRKYMPDDGILCLDNGMYKLWYARYYKARQPNTVLLDNALATMGAGLPSAMAAKLVHPDRKVLAICGDGGFMMNAQELETAVRLKLDLVILLLRDNAYGMIRWKQADMGYVDYGMQFGNPDFVLFAQAHGAHGHRPERADEFLPTPQTRLRRRWRASYRSCHRLFRQPSRTRRGNPSSERRRLIFGNHHAC